MSDNKRIVKNTILLYTRLLITMLVSIYTSRVILKTLGVEDFGIYNVVGGVVLMFSFLNSSISAATSRFIIFELGRKDIKQLKKVFNASLMSHIGIAIIVAIFAETIGMWFIINKLVIPASRMDAAIWTLQFSILTTMINLTQVPYNALIIAHEKMNIYAYVSVFDAILKLIIAYALSIVNFDKLVVYSALFCLVSLVIAFTYRIYCRKYFYEETCFCFQWNKSLYKTLFSFSIWELYGGLAIMGMGQGVNMLLNMFFGPAVNAARGIASQLEGAVSSFGNNFMTAVKPQIIKLYAEKEESKMTKLVFASSKYSFFLTIIFTLPLLLETRFILDIWLIETPMYATSFCQLVLINNLIWSLRGPIVTAIHAIGRIKVANLICGSIFYLVIIGSYIGLKLGLPPQSVFIITILVSLIVQIIDLIILKKNIQFSIYKYFQEVILLCFAIISLSGIIPLVLVYMLKPGYLRFLIIGLTSVISIMIMVYSIGVDMEIKKIINYKIKIIAYKLRRGKYNE